MSAAVTDLIGFHPELVRKGVFKGIDLSVFARRLWKLDAMRSESGLPRIRWRASARPWMTAGGTAHGTHSITMRLGPAATLENAVEVLLHELVHSSCPRRHHDELFCRRLIACAREAFGLELDTAALLALPAQQGCVAYAIDAAITKAMVSSLAIAKLRGDPGYRPEPAPVETELEIIARQGALIAARVQAREAHARAKLAEWEKRLAFGEQKLKAERRIAAKWRTKVRYYERRQEAAKRRTPNEDAT